MLIPDSALIEICLILQVENHQPVDLFFSELISVFCVLFPELPQAARDSIRITASSEAKIFFIFL